MKKGKVILYSYCYFFFSDNFFGPDFDIDILFSFKTHTRCLFIKSCSGKSGFIFENFCSTT